MNEKMLEIFQNNSKLIEKADKAVYYFRCQQYENALKYITDSIEGINEMVKMILERKDYFQVVEEESVIAMIEGILSAKRCGDFVLLADIYDLQLSRFISGIQELIIEKEDFTCRIDIYEQNLKSIEPFDMNLFGRLREPEEPSKLLEKGYSVEFSSCGLMTLAALDHGNKFYFHSNSHVMQEAFLLAKEWADRNADRYYVLGCGLFYHIKELLELTDKAEIYVFESDFDIIRLTCNFIDLKPILESDRVHFIYDETLDKMREAVKRRKEGESVVIHYPSYRNIKADKLFLEEFIPWLKILEDCQ